MIPRQQFIQELKIREKELIEELKAIRVILGNDDPNISDGDGQLERVTTTTIGTPKNKRNWADYIELTLKEIGGKGKSKDVAEAVIKANPKIDETTVLHAVRHHLSKLLKNNRIGAEKSEIQSEGYTFFIKP